MMGSHTDTSVQRTAGRQQAGSFSGDPPQAPVIFFSNFRKRKVFFFFFFARTLHFVKKQPSNLEP